MKNNKETILICEFAKSKKCTSADCYHDNPHPKSIYCNSPCIIFPKKINKDLKLSDREWFCPCGAKHDRDFLASCNIRDFAFDKQNLIGMGNPESTLVEMVQ